MDQSLFDTTTNDISKFMNDILDQIEENVSFTTVDILICIVNYFNIRLG